MTLGITWKEARRPVFKPSQNDDGRRRLPTVERLYQGAPASNSQLIRAGDKLISFEAEGSSRSMVGSGVGDVMAVMEAIDKASQDVKLEFLRPTDCFPFTQTLADKAPARSRNTFTVNLCAAPKKAETNRNVELAGGRPASRSGLPPVSRPGSRSGPPKRPGTRDSRPSSRSGTAGAHAPHPPPAVGRPAAARPSPRLGTPSRPKTTSWTITEDPEDPRSARPINATRFERLIFAVNKRLKDAAVLNLLSESYLVDRPSSPQAHGRHVMAVSRRCGSEEHVCIQWWGSCDGQGRVRMPA